MVTVRSLGYITDGAPNRQFNKNEEMSAPRPNHVSTAGGNFFGQVIPSTPVAVLAPIAQASSAFPIEVQATPTMSAMPAPIVASQSEEDKAMQAAWSILSTDTNWTSVEAKIDWHTGMGAHDVTALSFLMDEEIDGLESLLFPIPYRRFRKHLGK